MKKRYIDGLFGQVHLLETTQAEFNGSPPLFCLHATAYSSQTFRPLLSAFEAERTLYALDTPGYGASDRPPGPIDLGGYADAFAHAVRTLAAGPVDVLGYHTGAYIATEAAVRHPKLFRKLVLIGVPFFHGPDRASWQKRLASRTSLTTDLAQFDEYWNYFITSRSPRLSLERGFENFIDELRAYPHGTWAHEALFAYDDRERLTHVATPTLIVNPPGHLAEGSRNAARLLKRAEIIETPQFEAPIFETASPEIKDILVEYLDRNSV